MPYYLGIDGGGTKTTCAVGNGAQLLAVATAGPSNIVRVGEQLARESLHQSVRQACAAANIMPKEIACTCIGVAGTARPELAEIVRRILAEVLSTPVEVVGDMHIALQAAFDNGPGVVVIAGTGSIAYGRNAHGSTVRAGGWGFAIGDEGSAHWIGREAVRAALRDADEKHAKYDRERTPGEDHASSLAKALLKSWKLDSLADLARAANSLPPPEFAALFPAVVEAPDDLGRKILTQAGKELARIAGLVVRRLFNTDDRVRVPVAMVGGVFRYAALVREVFYNDLRLIEPRAEVHSQIIEPVQGALKLARSSAEAKPAP